LEWPFKGSSSSSDSSNKFGASLLFPILRSPLPETLFSNILGGVMGFWRFLNPSFPRTLGFPKKCSGILRWGRASGPCEGSSLCAFGGHLPMVEGPFLLPPGGSLLPPSFMVRKTPSRGGPLGVLGETPTPVCWLKWGGFEELSPGVSHTEGPYLGEKFPPPLGGV